MSRHRFDPLSFIFGLLFAGVAVLALIGVEVVALRDLAWIAPGLLVIAGAALLFTSAGRTRADGASDDDPSSAPPPPDQSEAADGEVARASDAPAMGQASEER